MSDRADLSGHRILVLEDSFLVAVDIRHWLHEAGATVLGPYASESAARRGLDTANPTGAVIDVNSGDGPSFGIAELLVKRGIPFVFFSGYQREVVPAAFTDAPYVQKFAVMTRLVGELAALLGENVLPPAFPHGLACKPDGRAQPV